MKTLVFNIESSKDVDLAVELIKKLNAPVEVISSPIAESKDPVVAYYEQKVEEPVKAKEISREEEEEELLIKQAAEAEAKEKAEADKKAKAAAKAEALKAKAEALKAKAAAAEQARLEKEAEEKAEAEAMDAAKAEAEAEAVAKAEAAAQKAKEERAALREKRTEPAEGTHISFEMIRIKMMKRIKEGAYTRESMTELLAKYGAKSLSNVKESDFAQLYYDLN
ncbi:hypothetical protein BD26P3_00024 [Phocaeicola phage BD26P3]|nr:hypothetical protein BD26P1_00013 [Phocaeicola phage BD26P1]WAX06094.1 hypothetical protein BD26P2_00047 [Phocaeicola phage BD26P2]WAX06120.1 hypothetical protein BD26P3_00024 [Phocaeicola phage BD26P3]WAX06191.1 hypothetical protein BD26P4_00047 [Phocaeicola phage BD26P4]WAX06217.1 hypothetical protein BD26P5_00024 [Phocaeicola phage BD26P5]